MTDWNWKIEEENGVRYDRGSNQIYVTIRIYKTTWTGSDKAIIKTYQFAGASETVETITAQLNTYATNEINDFIIKKAVANALIADVATVHTIVIA